MTLLTFCGGEIGNAYHMIYHWALVKKSSCILIAPRYPEEKDDNGRTLYGGVRDGVLVGGTKVRHSSMSIKSSNNMENHIVSNFGTGISSGLS